MQVGDKRRSQYKNHPGKSRKEFCSFIRCVFTQAPYHQRSRLRCTRDSTRTNGLRGAQAPTATSQAGDKFSATSSQRLASGNRGVTACLKDPRVIVVLPQAANIHQFLFYMLDVRICRVFPAELIAEGQSSENDVVLVKIRLFAHTRQL